MRKRRKVDVWKQSKIVRILLNPKEKDKAIEIAMNKGGSFMFRDDKLYVTKEQLEALTEKNIKMGIPMDT